MCLYIIGQKNSPPYLFALIYNDIHSIPIFIRPIFKEYLLFFGAILSHKTKEFNDMLTKVFSKFQLFNFNSNNEKPTFSKISTFVI